MITGQTPDHAEHFRAHALQALRIDGAPLPEGAPVEVVGSGLLVELPEGDAFDVSIAPPHTWRARWCLRVRVKQGDADGRGQLIGPDSPRARLLAPRPGVGLPARLEVGLSTLPASFIPPTPPPGCERVLLEDAAFGRHARQSSAALPASVPLRPGAWMRATGTERAPWWELDLGQPLYVDAVRLRFDVPPAARVRLRLHSAPEPDGGVRWPEASWSSDAPAVRATILQPRTVARHVRVELEATDPGVSLELASVEVLACRLFGDTLEGSVRRTFALFADRPLFARRERGPGGELLGYERWTRFAEVWMRALHLAGGLAPLVAALEPALPDPRDARPRHAVALWAANQAEWVIADLACVHQAWVVVPLAAAEGPERVAPVVLQARATVVVVGTAQRRHLPALLERCPSVQVVVLLPPAEEDDPVEPVPMPAGALAYAWDDLLAAGRAAPQVEWVEREPGDLHGVLFTSGSTGAPKGATRSYAAWNELLTHYIAVQPPVHLSFQPLSHFSERVTLPVVAAAGGRVGFSPGGARLYDDIAALRPTFLAAVPRVFDVLHARHQDALLAARRAAPDRPEAELEAELLPRARAMLGDRLQSIGVGSAPPTPALMEFLRRVLADGRVVEGYGSTECGGISVDDVVLRDVDVKLVDVPELGYTGQDVPPRGEICVKTATMVGCYLGDPDGTAARFDAGGYFHTGDLGRREPDGRVRIVGRRGDVIKLAQGEFVSPAHVEAALVHPLVDELFVHADPHQASVVALVVPRRDELRARLGPGVRADGPEAEALLLGALREAARQAELLPFQVPAAVAVVDGPLPLSANNKRDRRAIVTRHRDALARLTGGARADASSHRSRGRPGGVGAELDARSTSGLAPDPGAGSRSTVLDALLDAAREVTGRALDPHADLGRQLGVDSLIGVELLAKAQARLSRGVPLHAWFGATSLAELARRIEADAGVSSAARVTTGRPADDDPRADLERAAALDPRTLEAARALPAGLGREVLLTGATGFLGAHILDALVRRSPVAVRALVRAPDAAAGRARLRERFDAGRIAWTPEHEARVSVVPGDLALPSLGLDDATWCSLEGELDAIVHAGAVVNWLLLYPQLRAANVLGTLELLRLAGHGRPKAFHLVSTISTAPAEGDEGSALSVERALATSPYALSKWIGERHALAAADAGLPLVVHRPAMIAGHSVTGDCNADDFVHRYLIATAELGLALDLEDERLDMTPVDLVAEAVVALGAQGTHRGRTFHEANLRRSLSYAALARALRAAGVDTRPAPYAEFRGALEARPCALTPLRAFFPPRAFGLRMGPWPCGATDAALAAAGVAPRPIDDATIRVYADALRRLGRIPAGPLVT